MLKNILVYCKDSYEELAHKTTWPTRKELLHSAIVVLTASVIIALFVFAIVKAFGTIMEFVYSL